MSQDPRAQHSKRRSKANSSSSGGTDPGNRSVDYPRLIAAWRADFWGTISKMLPHLSVDRNEDPKPIDEGANFELIPSTIALALEYLVLDIDALSDDGGEDTTARIAFSCLTDLMQSIFLENREDQNDFNRLSGDVEQNLVRLHACIIALIARGDSVRVRELSRMTDDLLWIHRNLDISGMLRPPHDKGLSSEKQKIKLLVGLARMLQAGKLPTVKALRMELFGNIDAGNFSRLLNGLGVAKFIPRETTRPKDPHASTFFPIELLPDDVVQMLGYRKLLKSQRATETSDEKLPCEEPTIALGRSIKPLENPEMAQCEIRRIRESLGAAYWQLLIQFGMGELESYEDLEAFVEKLDRIGLELK
jgi:hypothetical protein